MVKEVKQRIVGMIIDQSKAQGDKIPSIRSLTAKMGCSHMTVVNAVQELTREGILKTQPKSGIFIARKPERYSISSNFSPMNTLYFFYYPSAIQLDTYHTDVFQYMSRESEWRKWNFRIGNLADKNDFKQAISDPNAAGIIFQANPQKIVIDFSENMIQGRPLIAYGMAPSPDVTSVSPDNYQGGWNLAEYLLARNHRHVHFIIPDEKETAGLKNRAFLERLHGVADCFLSHGVSLKETLPWSVNNLTEPVLSLLRRSNKEKSKHLTLIVTNCAMAKEIYLVARTMGFIIPRDLSIASFIRRNSEERNYPISCMDFSHEDMGQAITRLLFIPELIKNHSRIMLKMNLVENGSVKQ